MGDRYRVTKRINGRLSVYLQGTYRVGKSVRTENKYIGPATAAPSLRLRTTDMYASVVSRSLSSCTRNSAELSAVRT
jgi:hypothetical protein